MVKTKKTRKNELLRELNSLVESLKELREFTNSTDVESAHAKADELLLDFINDTEIKEAFLAISRWYE